MTESRQYVSAGEAVDGANLAPLVRMIDRYLEGLVTTEQVGVVAMLVSRPMHEGVVPPDVFLAALKRAIDSAGANTSCGLSHDQLRSLRRQLTPWLIDISFDPGVHSFALVA